MPIYPPNPTTRKYSGRYQLINRLSEQIGYRPKAIRILQKMGYVEKDGITLTAKGKERDAMTAKERAIERSARYSGRPTTDFRYNPATNRATLKPSALKLKKISSVLYQSISSLLDVNDERYT